MQKKHYFSKIWVGCCTNSYGTDGVSQFRYFMAFQKSLEFGLSFLSLSEIVDHLVPRFLMFHCISFFLSLLLYLNLESFNSSGNILIVLKKHLVYKNHEIGEQGIDFQWWFVSLCMCVPYEGEYSLQHFMGTNPIFKCWEIIMLHIVDTVWGPDDQRTGKSYQITTVEIGTKVW